MIASARLLLPVADVERSLRFYIERLGVKLAPSGALDLGGGFEVELAADPAPATVTLTLLVRGDFDEAIGTYDNRGVVMRRDAAHVESTDPDGHRLRFVAAPRE